MIVRRQRNRRRGFTLLEVLLVVAILVALSAILVPNLLQTQEGNKRDQAKLRVGMIENAFLLYNTHTGNFPTTDQGVNALLAAPSPTPKNWRGPYLKNADLTDPWGQPYNYQYPGTRSGSGGPDIWSNGPDMQSGTADDIGNWPSNL